MQKRLPIRHITEDSVKRALKIDSFRNISKEKIMEFASLIPYTDKEVAISIINQFPVFVDFGKIMISSYMQMCDKILENNRESYIVAVQGYQTILNALAQRLEKDITEAERSSITKDMISVADKIAELDLRNKKFFDRLGTKIVLGLLAAGAMIGAGIGIKSFLGSGENLPQISDDDDDEDEENVN